MPYPDRLEDVERLIEQHRQLKHQTLLLAIYFDCPEDPDSVHLLEVITPFGYEEVSDDKELFEMSYGSTNGFSLLPGSSLNILLTNATELQAAVRENWSSIRPVLAAVRLEQYRTIYKSEIGDNLLVLLKQTLIRDLVAA